MLNEEFVISSTNDIKLRFIFEIENDDSIIIKVKEATQYILYPKLYQGTFTKEELTDSENTCISIKNTKGILKEIASSFNSNKVTFGFNDSLVNLSYLLFDKFPISINIPRHNSDISYSDAMRYISSKLSSFNYISNKYQNLLKKISNNFSKNKNAFQLLQNQNHQLKKQSDISDLMKTHQKDIIEKLSFIENLFQQNQNQANLISHQADSNNKNIQHLLKNQTIIALKLHIHKTIYNDGEKNSMCFLRDGRLVSGGPKKIVVYSKNNFHSDIVINNSGNAYIVCGLSNGNLASGDRDDKLVRIYEIDGNQYKKIYTLRGHNDIINKIIELENGKLCSCSEDKTIKIWDDKNYYNCIRTLTGNENNVRNIIEMNDYIISCGGGKDNSITIWNKSTYHSIKTLKDIYSRSRSALSKLKKNKIILGGVDKLFILDILSFQYKSFHDGRLGYIDSICVMKEDRILIGNDKGMISCYDSLSNQIIFTEKAHDNNWITCIIEGEDNQIFSCSCDQTIKIYYSF